MLIFNVILHILSSKISLYREILPNTVITSVWFELSIFTTWKMIKNLPAMQEMRIQPLGQEDPLEKETATDSSILAWRIPWTEESGSLWSTGSHRARQDWDTFTFTLNILDDQQLWLNKWKKRKWEMQKQMSKWVAEPGSQTLRSSERAQVPLLCLPPSHLKD